MWFQMYWSCFRSWKAWGFHQDWQTGVFCIGHCDSATQGSGCTICCNVGVHSKFLWKGAAGQQGWKLLACLVKAAAVRVRWSPAEAGRAIAFQAAAEHSGRLENPYKLEARGLIQGERVVTQQHRLLHFEFLPKTTNDLHKKQIILLQKPFPSVTAISP